MQNEMMMENYQCKRLANDDDESKFRTGIMRNFIRFEICCVFFIRQKFVIQCNP